MPHTYLWRKICLQFHGKETILLRTHKIEENFKGNPYPGKCKLFNSNGMVRMKEKKMK